MKPAPQLAPRQEFDDTESYRAYLRAERVKAEETGRRHFLIVSISCFVLAALCLAAFIIYSRTH